MPKTPIHITPPAPSVTAVHAALVAVDGYTYLALTGPADRAEAALETLREDEVRAYMAGQIVPDAPTVKAPRCVVIKRREAARLLEVSAWEHAAGSYGADAVNYQMRRASWRLLILAGAL